MAELRSEKNGSNAMGTNARDESEKGNFMSHQNKLMSAALAGLAVGMAAASTEGRAEEKKADAAVQCYGVNSCKGQNACSVSKDQVKVAAETFGLKFAKSKSLDCAGSSACAGKAGNLAWVNKPAADCFKDGGFIFEKQKDNKLVIRNKAGIVKKG